MTRAAASRLAPSTDDANALAVARIAAVEPILVGFERAATALDLSEGVLGHAGPPFDGPERIPLPVLNALAGAALHEGWAGDLDGARRLVLDGKIELRSNHALGTVSPMAGVVRPGQMLARIEDAAGSRHAFGTLAEAGRRVLRFGVYDGTVAAGLRWLDTDLADALARALPPTGLALRPILAEAVTLGDDLHQRNVGAMHGLLRGLAGLPDPSRHWLLANHQHALNYAMAAAKLSLDAARGVAGSTIVTAIARNGDVCGIQLAGTGARWFSAPATVPDGTFFPPFSRREAQPDLGDSAIMEAFGLGGAVAHVAPELARMMGQAWADARGAGRRLRERYVSRQNWASPALAGAAGIGLGLDARRVMEDKEPVRIHTGIAHRDGETGWIGIGIATAPLACFAQALGAISEDEA